MKSLLLFLAVMLLIVSGTVYFATRPVEVVKAEEKSIEELEHVALFTDPEAYLDSAKLKRFATTDAGNGRVLFPKLSGDAASGKEPKYVRQDGYLGPESCRECHADMYKGFIETAHYKTSSLANSESLLGTFRDGEVAVSTKVRGLRYEVTREEEGFFQIVKVDRDGETYKHKQSIDIVTGSGNHGQTHLYWKDDRLYELPVSWFTASGWVNSPGFRDGFANFARPVQPGCIACHATLFEEDRLSVNQFDRNSVILGVTCEKCHGPGKAHVEYHQKNPDADESKFITHPDKLPRERMNDICGQCHTGRSTLKKSMFGFRPGDDINDFKTFLEQADGSAESGGVHSANQHPRLLQSRCYQESDSMNCATCHNPHQQEHGNSVLFSKRCQECHKVQDCGQFAISGQRIATNCIDCHMPKSKDNKTKMVVGKKKLFPEIRDHYIRVQMDATKAVLDSWEEEEKKND